MRTIGVILLGAWAAAAMGQTTPSRAPRFEIDALPVYLGYSRAGQETPTQIVVRNRGEAIAGRILVSSQPPIVSEVQVPARGAARVTLFPRDNYQGLRYSFWTPEGSASTTTAPAQTNPNQYESVHIGDRSMALGGRPVEGQVDRSREVANVRPQRAPERAEGYAGFAAVFLSDGAERMSDATFEALRRYLLVGGTVGFCGDAARRAMADPRWKPYLPGPKAGEGDTAKHYGLGRVVVYRTDPGSAENQEAARPDRFGSDLTTYQAGSRSLFTISFAAAPPTAATADGVAENPFSMQVPSVFSVFGILAGYFAVVVPLNFLILRKAKRGEWIWFTAPLASLAFAAVLFRTTGGLYRAPLSVETEGLLVVRQGAGEGVFGGMSQLFLPSAGTYEVGLDKVERVGPTETYQPGYGPDMQTSSVADFTVFDDGDASVKELRVGNLAFRSLEYRQRVPAGDWFAIRPLGDLEYEVKNASRYRLLGARLAAGNTWNEVGDLGPGQSKRVKIRRLHRSGLYDSTDLRSYCTDGDQTALEGRLVGFRPGPQIGKLATDRGVRLAFFGPGDRP